jgi:hypothetical protein
MSMIPMLAGIDPRNWKALLQETPQPRVMDDFTEISAMYERLIHYPVEP